MRQHRQTTDDQIPNARRMQRTHYRLDAPQFHFNFAFVLLSVGKLPPLVVGGKISSGPYPKQNVFPFFTGLPRRAARVI